MTQLIDDYNVWEPCEKVGSVDNRLLIRWLIGRATCLGVSVSSAVVYRRFLSQLNVNVKKLGVCAYVCVFIFPF